MTVSEHKTKIPIIMLTGFLGAGKTSLLNRLLKLPEAAQTGLIINEFGTVGIDDRLAETAEESLVELMNGCLCCTIKGDLPDSLAAMLERADKEGGRLNRIIIETTGLADPAPILQALLGAPFLQPRLYLQQVITVLDSTQAAQTLADYREARRQIAFADTIMLSKTDLLSDKTAAQHLERQIKELNSAAQIKIPPLQKQTAAAEAQFYRSLLHFQAAKATLAAAAEQQHHHHAHDGHRHNPSRHGSIFSFILSAAEPLPLSRAEYFVSLLSETYGRKILRLKGIIDTGAAEAGDRRYYSLQAVQGRSFPPQIFRSPAPNSGTNEAGSEIVIIADGAPEQDIRRLFASCLNRPAPDTADYAALSDNPLAIAGLKF